MNRIHDTLNMSQATTPLQYRAVWCVVVASTRRCGYGDMVGQRADCVREQANSPS